MTEGYSWADSLQSTNLGSSLKELLYADGLLPGDVPSYQLAKKLFLLHPLAGKMAESPVRLAMSQEREIKVESPFEDDLVEAFKREWKEIGASDNIINVKTQSRVYGIATLAVLTEGTDSSEPLNFETLYKQRLAFNIFDPLNTSGSLVMNQNPNDALFQKHSEITVAGQRYHRSRTRTILNGPPIYIAWTESAFGYVGRSCYQRAFYPLKSFLQSMVTDDMVTRKAGVLVAKMEQPGSIINRAMQGLFAGKRALLREARTDNVLSISVTEAIETLNMMNIDGAYGMCRENIIKNCAAGDDMPAKLLTQDAYVEGFGEGTQDAYAIAAYIEGFRNDMHDDFEFMDRIVQRRAWSPEFFKTLKARFPKSMKQGGLGDTEYNEAFTEWRRGFHATWPSLIKEPPSELAQVDEIKLKAAIAAVQVFLPVVQADPESMVDILDWAASQFNQRQELFTGQKLVIDNDRLLSALEKQAKEMKQLGSEGGLGEAENAEPSKPFSGHDSKVVASLVGLLRDKRSEARA